MSANRMSIKSIKSEDRFYFSGETGYEFVNWIGLNEDLKKHGYNTDLAIRQFRRKGAFSFEHDGTRIRCKIYGVQSTIYESGFIDCIIRFSRGPQLKISTIVISKIFADSIAENMRVKESYEDIAKAITRHYEYSSSKCILKKFPYSARIFVERKCRQIGGYKKLIGFIGGTILSSLLWNWETLYQNLKHIMKFFYFLENLYK